jgi:hypothetical protein
MGDPVFVETVLLLLLLLLFLSDSSGIELLPHEDALIAVWSLESLRSEPVS